jgi:hypothetical protein
MVSVPATRTDRYFIDDHSLEALGALRPCFLDMLGVLAEVETNLRRERHLEGLPRRISFLAHCATSSKAKFMWKRAKGEWV